MRTGKNSEEYRNSMIRISQCPWGSDRVPKEKTCLRSRPCWEGSWKAEQSLWCHVSMWWQSILQRVSKGKLFTRSCLTGDTSTTKLHGGPWGKKEPLTNMHCRSRTLEMSQVLQESRHSATKPWVGREICWGKLLVAQCCWLLDTAKAGHLRSPGLEKPKMQQEPARWVSCNQEAKFFFFSWNASLASSTHKASGSAGREKLFKRLRFIFIDQENKVNLELRGK